MSKRKREDLGLVWDDVLVFHILPKLPVQTLFGFKCVCKKWLNWISQNPIFIREQSRNSLASPGIGYMGPGGLEFLLTGGTQIDIFQSSLKFLGGSEPHILAACNGLLCISVFRPRSCSTIFMCNPVTREWSLIPDRWQFFFGLAFDPLNSPHVYKLVCFHTTGELGNKELRFEVFSSDIGVWTTSAKNVAVIDSELYSVSKSVFTGGVIYWVVGTQLVWFDPERDLAGVLMLPWGKDVMKHLLNCALGVWKERLTYANFVHDKMEAWVMSEFKWTRVFQASLDSAIKGVGTGMSSLLSPKAHILPYHGGEFLYFAVQNKKRLDVIYYNMKTREFTKSHAYGNDAFGWPFFTYNNNFVRLPKTSKHVNKIN